MTYSHRVKEYSTIPPCIRSDNQGFKLQKPYKLTEIKQLSSKLPMGQGRKKKEMKYIIEFKENECTTYSNLWETMKAVLRGKLIPLNACKKNLEKYHITMYFN